MDRGHDHDDEPKDFGGGYLIVKKDHYRARKPVQTKSEWTRITRSWKQGVELLYPHWKSELATYMEIIEELFHAAPRTPSVAICINVKAWVNMQSTLIGWTTIINSILLSLLRCFEHLHRHLLRHLVTRENIIVLLHCHPTRRLVQYAGIGTLGSVTTMSVPSSAHTSVMNAEKLTEQKTETIASESSKRGDKLQDGQNPQPTTSEMKGTRSLAGKRRVKRKDSDFPDSPLFCRRFVWSRHQSNDILSPAIAATEYAEPLPSPPEILVNNPQIQYTFHHLNQYIKVETPFYVDWFENLLADHPNKPFVKSVMKGLHEGFWPFDEGEWDLELKKFRQNYAVEDEDLTVIRAFHDKQIDLGRWSNSLPDTNLQPGMKISPMFVIWQHEKSRVITDHAGSGLNDGIPREEARVQYDDMHTFSQALYDAIQDNPLCEIITFKSDIALAFLNICHVPYFLGLSLSFSGLPATFPPVPDPFPCVF